jgi:hypothetical protein
MKTHRVIWGLLIVIGVVIAVAVRSGFKTDNYISHCLDETSGSYIIDASASQVACK